MMFDDSTPTTTPPKQTSSTNQFRLCDSCNAGVANDDWTHLDYYHEPQEAEVEHSKILATLETLGWLSHSHTSEDSGYFDCAVCDETQCGNPNIWVGEAALCG